MNLESMEIMKYLSNALLATKYGCKLDLGLLSVRLLRPKPSSGRGRCLADFFRDSFAIGWSPAPLVWATAHLLLESQVNRDFKNAYRVPDALESIIATFMSLAGRE
jgi:hypothetical protein